jgi:hypothetical protein
MSPASPPPLRPPATVRRLGLLGALGLAATLGACSVKATPVNEIGLDRSSPRRAYEYLKAMVRANQVEAEWRAFSPGFKRRLSEQAGRTIDIGDYAHARATIASNSTHGIAMILDSEVVDEKVVSPDLVLMTIRSGRQTATPRWVRMKTWELRLKGEGEPVSEFVAAEENVVRIAPDGSVQMRVVPSSGTGSFLKNIPQDRIDEFHVVSEWYLDDFGGVEDAVVGGLRADPRPAAPPPRSGGQPRRTTAPASPARVVPPPPAAPGAIGSPDGVTLR